MSSKFCTNCGTQNTGNARFCSECGEPLETAQPPAQAVNDPPASQDYNDGSQAVKQQQSFNGTPPKRKKTGLTIAIIVIAVLAISAGIFFGIRAFGGEKDNGYYEIGGERIPSVAYALGESRKLQSTKDANNNGIVTLSFVYNSSSAQSDMGAYAAYLQRKDGFAMRTTGVTFEQKTGLGIQLWRNAEVSGFMIILQLDYDEKGYTITVMRGEGQATGVPGTSEPQTSAQPQTPAPSASAPATGSPTMPEERYVNTAVGFSIVPRDGWYAEETTSDGTSAVLVTTPKNDRIVIMSMSGYTMADLAADEENFCLSTVQSMGGDGYTIDRSENIKLADYDCHLTGFTATTGGTPTNYIYNYAFDGGSGNLYVIMYVLPPTATDEDNQELMDVFSTFKIQ